MYDLGLTDAQFCEITPRFVFALWDRHLDAQQRMDRRFATFECLYANAHRDPARRAHPFSVEDFMPTVAASGGSNGSGRNVRDLPIWMLTEEERQGRLDQNRYWLGEWKAAAGIA